MASQLLNTWKIIYKISWPEYKFVNDLKKSTKLLDPIISVDETIFFHTNNNINVLFETVNKKLHYANGWFRANKLSLYTGKAKYLFFHKQSARDSIPLTLPTKTFKSMEIKRETFIKFFVVIMNEKIIWNKYIELVENKILKNIGIL